MTSLPVEELKLANRLIRELCDIATVAGRISPVAVALNRTRDIDEVCGGIDEIVSIVKTSINRLERVLEGK